MTCDPLELAEISGLGDELWGIHGPRILRKFDLLESGRLRNAICFEDWSRARMTYEKRSSAADKTNSLRLAHGDRTVTVDDDDGNRTPTVSGRVYVDVSVPLNTGSTIPDSVDCRVLSERVGIFAMREQADMLRCLSVHVKASGQKVADAIEHMIARWEQYQARLPDLGFTPYTTSYKFFMSGNWNRPEAWAERKNGDARNETVAYWKELHSGDA